MENKQMNYDSKHYGSQCGLFKNTELIPLNEELTQFCKEHCLDKLSCKCFKDNTKDNERIAK